MDPLAPLDPLVELAIETAAQWHEGTHRKSAWRPAPFALPPGEACRVPTFAHLAAVASAVQAAGWPAPVVAAAYLHDLLEDPNRFGVAADPEALRRRVGAETAALVEHVTERRLDSEGRLRSWEDRKQDYVRHLAEEAPPEAVAISLADKLHNLYTMRRGLEAGLDPFAEGPGRRALSAGPERQMWFYRAVLEAAARHADSRLDGLKRQLAAEIERFGAAASVSTKNA